MEKNHTGTIKMFNITNVPVDRKTRNPDDADGHGSGSSRNI
jgi:hypothetical protein